MYSNLFDNVDYVENAFQNLVNVAVVSPVNGVVDDQHQFKIMNTDRRCF